METPASRATSRIVASLMSLPRYQMIKRFLYYSSTLISRQVIYHFYSQFCLNCIFINIIFVCFNNNYLKKRYFKYCITGNSKGRGCPISSPCYHVYPANLLHTPHGLAPSNVYNGAPHVGHQEQEEAGKPCSFCGKPFDRFSCVLHTQKRTRRSAPFQGTGIILACSVLYPSRRPPRPLSWAGGDYPRRCAGPERKQAPRHSRPDP